MKKEKITKRKKNIISEKVETERDCIYIYIYFDCNDVEKKKKKVHIFYSE